MKLWVDSDRTVEVDEGLIPTGKLLRVEKEGPLDFGGEEGRERELKEVLGDPRAKNLCGPGELSFFTLLIEPVHEKIDRESESSQVVQESITL